MHPPHVPLHPEAEAAQVRRARHRRPGRGFLRDGLRVGMLPVGVLVHATEEPDGLEVLPAAVLVRDPLALLAGVVEVQHRGHGVHAEPVGVVRRQPVQRRRRQERPDLVAAVIEDVAVPVRVDALARIRVLVEVRPVEHAERERVGREV